MKICIPTLGIDNRGGTRVLVEAANRLSLRDHQIVFIIPQGTNRTTFVIDERVQIVECGPRLPQVEDVSSILRLTSLIAAIPECDLVIANYYLTSYPAAIAIRRGKARAGVYFIQHYEPLAFGQAERTFPHLKQKLAELTYRLPLRQITVAGWIASRVEAISKKPVKVIRPGLNPAFFHPADRRAHDLDGQNILVFPGNNVWKGWQDFSVAFELLQRRLPEVEAMAASQEPFPLQENGYLPLHPQNDHDLADAYRQAKVYVHPAWWEGCPLAPLEAMACGTPVVAAASEGIKEYAVHGENSWLVPVKNPEALAEGIYRVLTDGKLRRKLIQGGQATARQFSWEYMTDELETFFITMLGE